MTSLGASIPPELFVNILDFIGFESFGVQLSPIDPTYLAARREVKRCLSACASTCLYWAKLTRDRLFRDLAVRSRKDLHDLRSLLRSSPNAQLAPVGDFLYALLVFHTVGDHFWLYELPALVASEAPRLAHVILRVSGPATPSFIAASTQRPVLHPLSYSAPRHLPIPLFHPQLVHVELWDLDLPNPAVLFNLLQDCLLLEPQSIFCRNVTWDLEPTATNPSLDLKVGCLTDRVWATNCTDDILVAMMMLSIPHHRFSRRRQGPHLSVAETSRLFNIMNTTFGRTSRESEPSFGISTEKSDFDAIQKFTGMTLSLDSDFCLVWTIYDIEFICIASRLPGDIDGIRHVTYIAVTFPPSTASTASRETMVREMANIDWNSFFSTARQLPHLRRIAIQHTYDEVPEFDPREFLLQLVTHLGEAPRDLDDLFELYIGGRTKPRVWPEEYEWTRLDWDDLLEESRRKREELQAVEVSSNDPRSAVEDALSPHDTAPTNSVPSTRIGGT